jgi:aminopeptidase N
MKQKIYRKDYTPSNYLITSTNLTFEIKNDDSVIVKSSIDFYTNTNAKKSDELFLNGENLELLNIEIDKKTPNFEQKDDGILLKNLPKKFTLKTAVKIYPAKNTALAGLYRSGKKDKQMFCTQCEAHGFRNITYYLDRPDVLSVWSVEIIADINKYPTQLSNGNFDGKKWLDPHPKPCYLFALVIGDLAITKDKYKNFELEIYTDFHNQHKTDFAMDSLKNAMMWDENRFGLSYDLDKFMIVAVDDFNMGAMENKGLNIFNSSLVLASSQSATDKNYLDIEAVIGHEYFHNWTGNRITCRDWFQLSLKEGLTVFRDQEFSSDLRNREIKRIEDVSYLRTHQFSEDSSNLSHPVRPESYIEMDNFYTLTVYEKGSEIVRMIHTILGESGFQNLMQKYVKNFDGRAVTIDDFVDCGDFENKDKFKIWYEKSGTPTVEIIQNNNKIIITQNDERITPIKYGILDKNGDEITSGVLLLGGTQNEFDFSKFAKNGEDLTFSWLRDFSAPVILKDNLTNHQRVFLAINDSNTFVRFDNIQKLLFLAILKEDDGIFESFDAIIRQEKDNAILSKLLKLPTNKDIYATQKVINVAEINQKLTDFKNIFANKYAEFFNSKYQELCSDYEFNTDAIYKRELKNLCLENQGIIGNFESAYLQFKNPSCATDKMAAFNILLGSDFRDEVIGSFYDEFNNDDLMLNKWFLSIASHSKTTCKDIEKLLKHEKFDLKNPNKVRSLIGGFSANNVNFHSKCGYEILTQTIEKLNKINPQIGARLATNFTNYHKFTNEYKNLQLENITKIKNIESLSANIFEIINS